MPSPFSRRARIETSQGAQRALRRVQSPFSRRARIETGRDDDQRAARPCRPSHEGRGLKPDMRPQDYQAIIVALLTKGED